MIETIERLVPFNHHIFYGFLNQFCTLLHLSIYVFSLSVTFKFQEDLSTYRYIPPIRVGKRVVPELRLDREQSRILHRRKQMNPVNKF